MLESAVFPFSLRHLLTRAFVEDSGSNTLPDFTQERITHIPQIQKLYDAYQQGFEHEYTSYESHMTRAQALAVAMLEHYYPKNQGFTVEPCTFNVMAAHGWAFWLHPEPTGAATGPGAAHKKKAASTAPQWEMFSAKYHRILPERIAGYVVYQEHTVIDKDGNEYLQDYPHTYLGIMMDDLQTFNNWVPDRNSTGGVSIPRAELLSYSLGVQAKIRHGYGILLLGPRIEFYDYNNDAQSAMSRIKSENWAIDMRYQTLSMVNVVFKGINERTIIYQDGSVGEGAMKPMT